MTDHKPNHKPRFTLLPRDPLGHIIPLKRALIGMLALTTYSRFNILNRLKVEGMEHLEKLPPQNVLFISNHQTYYADVMAMYHIFNTVKSKLARATRLPVYALMPRTNMYYVAAEETMKQSGFFPRLLSYAGAVTVKRSWRFKGQEVQRGADVSAPEKIKKALEHGWVVNFPQGTTSPYAPVRKGTANLIRTYQPIVVPVVIDGFRQAFDKRGLGFKKLGTTLTVRFKAPLEYGPDDSLELLTQKIVAAIEQVPPADTTAEA